MGVLQVHRVLVDVLHQRRNIIRHPEQHRASIEELRLDVTQTPRAQPVIARQVQGFLWCACAFDRHWRLAEQRTAFAQVLHQLPGVGRQVIAIVGSHTISAEGFAQAIDGLPVKLQTRAHHQLLVAQQASIIQGQRLRLRVEAFDAGLDPANPGRNGRRHASRGTGGIEDSGTDHCPAGLIVMGVGRVNEGDIQRRIAAHQA
ncbi:hypothetical protein D3C72_1166050 [compost metagenome]